MSKRLSTEDVLERTTADSDSGSELESDGTGAEFQSASSSSEDGFACSTGRFPSQLLVGRGGVVIVENNMAGLDIHEAAATGDHDALEDFLKSGKFDVNLKDVEFHNRTALHWACSKGYAECVRTLLDFGAKGTSRTDEGWTPAHCAAETGRIPPLRVLHNAGISVNRKDKYGDKPRRIANIYDHTECAKYLKQTEGEIIARRDPGCTSDDSDCNSDDDEPTTVKSETTTPETEYRATPANIYTCNWP